MKPEVVPVLEGRPQFGPRPGTYSYSPMLTISYPHNGAGDIHYTMDGTTPDEESSRYDSPVSIGEGMTVVRAVFIREDGVQSEEAAGTYHVEFQCPAEPVFSIPAGTYEGGITVTITGDEGSRIYYTTNGEEPGIRSKLYQGPVRIGPGLTVLQAIAVDQEGEAVRLWRQSTMCLKFPGFWKARIRVFRRPNPRFHNFLLKCRQLCIMIG